MGVALVTLAVVTALVALVSDVFVSSVQAAAAAFGMTPASVGFVNVALVGGAAALTAVFSAAAKDRLDLSVGVALGSGSCRFAASRASDSHRVHSFQDFDPWDQSIVASSRSIGTLAKRVTLSATAKGSSRVRSCTMPPQL